MFIMLKLSEHPVTVAGVSQDAVSVFNVHSNSNGAYLVGSILEELKSER
jgi:hypothetical protein